MRVRAKDQPSHRSLMHWSILALALLSLTVYLLTPRFFPIKDTIAMIDPYEKGVYRYGIFLDSHEDDMYRSALVIANMAGSPGTNGLEWLREKLHHTIARGAVTGVSDYPVYRTAYTNPYTEAPCFEEDSPGNYLLLEDARGVVLRYFRTGGEPADHVILVRKNGSSTTWIPAGSPPS